jgi:hypothetical protein
MDERNPQTDPNPRFGQAHASNDGLADIESQYQ